MSEDTIKIKKQSLWKYATFVLVLALVLVLIFAVGKGPSGNTVKGDTTSGVDLGVFLSDSSLFPSIGPENAKHTIVEFGDFQCIWCADAAGLSPYWEQVSKTNAQVGSVFGSMKLAEDAAIAGKVRFVYVPVSFFGAESTYTSEAGYCANEQGKFWEMHDAIFAAHDGQENDGQFAKEKLKVLASRINGLNTNKFNNCLDNDETLSEVQSSTNAAKSFGVSGTPTVYVDGQKVNPTAAVISTVVA